MSGPVRESIQAALLALICATAVVQGSPLRAPLLSDRWSIECKFEPITRTYYMLYLNIGKCSYSICNILDGGARKCVIVCRSRRTHRSIGAGGSFAIEGITDANEPNQALYMFLVAVLQGEAFALVWNMLGQCGSEARRHLAK